MSRAFTELIALSRSSRHVNRQQGLLPVRESYVRPQICAQCALNIRRWRRQGPIPPSPPHRPFSTYPALFKKGGKAAREEKSSTSPTSAKGNAGGTATDDPFDFTTLEADIASAVERLKNNLSRLRAGGRFNPEVLENLRVQPDKSSNQTVKLSDVAQVIPKGRVVQIMVGEKDHIKPITTAIQSSTLSLTPQADPTGTNPLLLLINIPPPTAESRKAVVDEASKAGEKAGTSLRDARGKQQKKLRALQVAKSARPDDLKKAGTLMEKVVEKGTGEVKRIVDSARKVLESG
ncbi:hypothetical protein LTR78_004358 [Recurvomyces mirabilis]|uniref:Ribosome recycling factor domain-containing protein n=1 Tax=Recurvomyces mirabilis TaxID=574656 RepID=A0AAE1C2N5_9PEZI|nr:hypothetical protein LTR78_004358 [Recurvomyces mirabilis]KAK5155976.1 hypothetical protein LTS14_005542 [Recurvomyces mirabilis]